MTLVEELLLSLVKEGLMGGLSKDEGDLFVVVVVLVVAVAEEAALLLEEGRSGDGDAVMDRVEGGFVGSSTGTTLAMWTGLSRKVMEEVEVLGWNILFSAVGAGGGGGGVGSEGADDGGGGGVGEVG